MKQLFSDAYTMDDVKRTLRKLKSKNDLNMMLIVGIGVVLTTAVAIFCVMRYKCKCEDRWYDDDCCCNDDCDDDDNCCCGDNHGHGHHHDHECCCNEDEEDLNFKEEK